MLEFTVVDTGIGIRGALINKFKINIDSLKAIIWATQEGNTTKDNITGA